MTYTVAKIYQVYKWIQKQSGKARAEHGYCENIILTLLDGVKIRPTKVTAP